MDTERIAGLAAEIKDQLWLMEKVSDHLQARVDDSLEVMNKLGSFRHLIRYAYGTEIELTQLQANLSSAKQLYGLIQHDIDTFLVALTATAD